MSCLPQPGGRPAQGGPLSISVETDAHTHESAPLTNGTDAATLHGNASQHAHGDIDKRLALSRAFLLFHTVRKSDTGNVDDDEQKFGEVWTFESHVTCQS